MILPILSDVCWFVVNLVCLLLFWRWLNQAFSPIWSSIKEDTYLPNATFLRIAISVALLILTVCAFNEIREQSWVWLTLLA